MNVRLALLPKPKPSAVISAGWLPSSDPADWLAEIARCRRQGRPVAIYPVAAGVEYRTSVGVLLVPVQAVPDFGPRVQPLAELLPGLHAPLESELNAGLLENERSYFFPHRFHFLHPVIGLVGFEEKDALPAHRLLVMPLGRDERWNLAAPVRGLAPSLKSIEVAEPLPPEEMLGEAAKEIGDQAGQPAKDDGGVLGKAGMIGKGLAGGVVLGAGLIIGGIGKAISAVGGGNSSNEVPPGSLREWAEKNWQFLMDRRSREIERLMKLMEENPDEGLRHALPLAGIEGARGTATPGWKLGPRNVNFTNRTGGAAADGWDIAGEARLKLEKQYRDAAKRESALGRHERAAYIYGNLLGDWSRAAQALVEGGRHRDAVSIYIHKLNNRAAAAKCYEDAGMLIQAAALYAETKQFEKAGDLHGQLGNTAQAMELWRTAVEQNPDTLEKARILSRKLNEPAAALEILDAGWQAGDRPVQCLAAMLAIHHEAKAADEAILLLGRTFNSGASSFPLTAKLDLAHQQTELWADPVLTKKMEDESYRRIGEVLTDGGGSQAALLAFLPKLDAGDLLLSRDARRYSIKAMPPKIPRLGPPEGILRPKAVHGLTGKSNWHSLSRTPDGVSVAGYGNEMLCVAELVGESVHSSGLRTSEDPGRSEVLHVALKALGGASRVFHFKKFGRLHHHAMGRARSAAEAAIGTLRDVLAVGPYGADGDFVVLQFTGVSSLAFSIYSEAATLRTTTPIDLATKAVADMDWRIAGHGGHLCIAADGFLAWRHPSGQFLTMNLGQVPHALHLSPLPSAREAVVSLPGEVILVEIPKPGKGLETVNLHTALSSSVRPPVACYLPDGSVVIAYPGGGLVYAPTNRVNHSAVLEIPPGAGEPVDISPSGKSGFAVLTSHGKLLVFEY